MNVSLEEVLGPISVSRETFERLAVFEDLVKKWSAKINLVSRKSLAELRNRHTIDSIQAFRIPSLKGHWVDLGSGGGFPGIVAAILAKEIAPELRFTLVESDKRKATFLRTAVRETRVNCHVLCERIENAPGQAASILSARALADLSTLLMFCEKHLESDGIALFLKGVTWEKEVEEARRDWAFEVTSIPSQTEQGSVILKIEGVSRV